MQSVAQKIRSIRSSLPPNVKLIAVTKQATVSAMRVAYSVGIRDFGENRLQVATPKQQELADLPEITWHFIGTIQKNKAKKILEQFDWIHSVDRLEIAQTLNSLAQQQPKRPKILLQIKLLPDANKQGWSKESLLENLKELQTLQNLDIIGLMTILPLGLSPEEQYQTFGQLKTLQHEINHHPDNTLHLTELSMGMSDDYLIAIKAGATSIRLGQILFSES